ncbi:hypothetical protein [Niveibacterium sp. 24ML]|nr:hypothetical protein [Niveibacterium sp. 24ML]
MRAIDFSCQGDVSAADIDYRVGRQAHIAGSGEGATVGGISAIKRTWATQ